MLIIDSIQNLSDWCDKNICALLKFKKPNDNENDADSEFISPASFPMFVPGKDKLPPNIAAPVPSLCVQIMEGSDDLIAKSRKLTVRFCLSTWNPGEVASDLYIPIPDDSKLGGFKYRRSTGAIEELYFKRNVEGWLDVFNFLDTSLRELENAEYIAGMRLVKEEPIKYGPFTEDGEIWDYYPYWFCWITFSLECGVVQKPPEAYKDLL